MCHIDDITHKNNVYFLRFMCRLIIKGHPILWKNMSISTLDKKWLHVKHDFIFLHCMQIKIKASIRMHNTFLLHAIANKRNFFILLCLSSVKKSAEIISDANWYLQLILARMMVFLVGWYDVDTYVILTCFLFYIINILA